MSTLNNVSQLIEKLFFSILQVIIPTLFVFKKLTVVFSSPTTCLSCHRKDTPVLMLPKTALKKASLCFIEKNDSRKSIMPDPVSSVVQYLLGTGCDFFKTC